MKVVVFDVAAESGGALTVLESFFSDSLKLKGVEWHYILSVPNLIGIDNIKVHKYDWIKKSWFHRLYFDFFIAHKIVEDLNPDIVLSLQNIVIPFISKRQVTYFHQILPFTRKKFSVLKHPKLWVYKNIIGKIILYSVRKTDQLIVQTEWIKDMFVKKYNIDEDKIIVKKVEFNISVSKKFSGALQKGKKIYFYPASAEIYKNHQVIVQAAKQLINSNIKNFEILFTLEGNENTSIKKLKKIISDYNLPIKFIGKLTLKQVYELYSESILIFPSEIETIGLPLIEARMHETPIIAAKLEYAEEVLVNYQKVEYFDLNDSRSLYQILKKDIEKSMI